MDERSNTMMGDGYGGQGWMNDGMGWGGWLMMALVVLSGVALVCAVVYLLVRRPRNQALGEQPGPPVLSSAEATLDERFARGEIDEDDYRLRRAALRANA